MADSISVHNRHAPFHDRGMADSISVLNRGTVRPAQMQSPPRNFFLSCLDLYWQHVHYNQRLLFYDTCTHDRPRPSQDCSDRLSAPPPEGGDGLSAPTVMQNLKLSLALCLSHYYPWCGRLVKGAEPPHRIFIDCSDAAGVEFVEASSPLPLSQFARDGFQMKPLFQQLCQPLDHKGDHFFSSPLLSIQATLFADGGLVIGVTQSHVVADGQSLWNFMVSWGECARGVPLSLPPQHNREMLAVPDPSPEKATWSLNFDIKEEDIEEEPRDSDDRNPRFQKDEEHKLSSSGTIKDKDNSAGTDAPANEENANGVEVGGDKDGSAGTNASSAGDKTEPLVQYMLDMPASAVKKLKSEAGGGHTSFEVMCAHFWKCLAAARESAKGEPTYFLAHVNCRTRTMPPVPASYFGNVVGFDVALSTVSAIRRETTCATACRIHDLVARIKEDYILDFMHWLETHNNSLLDVFDRSKLKGKGFSTASSPWFPAYKVDYGWGKPVAVRSSHVHGDGELVLFGGKPGSMPGDVEICTALPESVFKRLLEDPSFLARLPRPHLGTD